uniref:Uncharacterized protein n=1 Tax=Anguilla anguilla TaxID=7936 RepID=A0A0E9V236_ANGAN
MYAYSSGLVRNRNVRRTVGVRNAQLRCWKASGLHQM